MDIFLIQHVIEPTGHRPIKSSNIFTNNEGVIDNITHGALLESFNFEFIFGNFLKEQNVRSTFALFICK